MRSVRGGGCGLDNQCRMPSLNAQYEIRNMKRGKEADGGANNKPAEKSGDRGLAWHGMA